MTGCERFLTDDAVDLCKY